jgi:hypothetical protein
MAYDNRLIAKKLLRWEKYLLNYRLPEWEEIPDLGLYMEQVITLLKQYLDYYPPDVKGEQSITAAAINNYVRTKVMPGPHKKKYHRTHIAYLVMIFSLKQGLSIAMIQRLLPVDLSEDRLREVYSAYVTRHKLSSKYFTEQVRAAAAPLLSGEPDGTPVDGTVDIITTSAIIGGFARLLAEKLLLLEDKNLEDIPAAETAPPKA